MGPGGGGERGGGRSGGGGGGRGLGIPRISRSKSSLISFLGGYLSKL